MSVYYRGMLEREAVTILLIYSALIMVLLPLFGPILQMQPNPPPDSMALRLLGALIAGIVALIVILVPKARRHIATLQVVNVFPTFIIVIMLVANSGNNPLYVASGMLVVVGIEQAFYRVRDLVAVFVSGFIFQLFYEALLGLLHRPQGIIVLIIYASAYVIAFPPAFVNIRTRERELAHRLAAERARAELARELEHQTLITKIVEFIRSTFDLQSVLDNVAQALGSQLDADRVHVALREEGGNDFVVKSEYRRDTATTPSLLGKRLESLRWAKFARTLLKGETVHVKDVARAELTPAQRQFFLQGHTKEFATIPILAQDRATLLGFIAINSTRGTNRLSADEISFLQSISGQVAIAIQQSQVYERLQQELEYRRRQEARLSDLANRDPLTGIFNRRYFMEELQTALRHYDDGGTRGAIFFMDLDHFKIVNDSLGHDAGDRVLMAVPKVIRGALRESDLLARIGGDEFAVLLPDVRPGETMAIAEKISKSVDGYKFRESGRTYDIGVSIGVAVLDPSATPLELLARADEACYQAKARGRNGVQLWSKSG